MDLQHFRKLSQKYSKKFVQFHEDIPRWFHRRNIMTWKIICKISNYAFRNASIEAT